VSRYLIVFPDDSVRPILDAIDQATTTLRIKMFMFSDPHILTSVIKAHRRGVRVRVMLNPARRDGKSQNQETHRQLTEAGVEVMDSAPAFEVTHEKSMVVDEKAAWIMSLNWETKNLTETRDYAVVTSHAHEVQEISECFEADWARSAFNPGERSHMIWCVGNARQRISQFIDEAKHSLWVQNERYQDPLIIEHLVRAKRRGVKVHIMARPPHTLKDEKLTEGVAGLRILDDVGVKVRKVHGLKLHAKLMYADRARAIIGSINLAPGSFNSRRELAIEVRDREVVDRVHQLVHYDWKHSRPMDLSDRGLIDDLGKRGKEIVAAV
jgi:phosphatidylserine/phosphatidylglycerophosphate/cardiolipin synthase-like enzyme